MMSGGVGINFPQKKRPKSALLHHGKSTFHFGMPKAVWEHLQISKKRPVLFPEGVGMILPNLEAPKADSTHICLDYLSLTFAKVVIL